LSYTFNIALVNLSDHVRLALSDNDAANPILQDETINAKLTALGYCEGLAQCAEAVRIWLGNNPDAYDEGSGGLKQEWKARDKTYSDLIRAARTGQIAPPDGDTDRIGSSVGPIGSSVGGLGIYDYDRAACEMRTD
jgi:hypothetical protein